MDTEGTKHSIIQPDSDSSSSIKPNDTSPARSKWTLKPLILILLVLGIAVWALSDFETAGIRAFIITLVSVLLVGSAYVTIWFRAKAKNVFAGFECKNLTELKDVSLFLQGGVTVLILIIGAGWGLYTWAIQNQNYRANQEAERKKEIANQVAEKHKYISSVAPALEVRIFAQESTSRYRNSVFEDRFRTEHPRARLITGWVSIKNVGAQKTNVRLCECTGTGKNPPPSCDNNVNQGTHLGVPKCHEGDPKGPLVVSKVSWNVGGMELEQLNKRKRFWLVRPSVDKERLDIEPTDEMRPNAEDKFEFLVKVPGPGVYAVMFTAPIDQEEFDRMKKAGHSMPPWPLRWDATTFVEVK
jgi:hypothetical protein